MNTLADLTERQFSSQVYELAALLGWSRYHTWRAKHSPAGFPDETLWRDRVVFLELKTEAKTSRCSPAQKETIRGLLKAGAEVYVCRPRDLDDLARVLNARSPFRPHTLAGSFLRLRERTRAEVDA